MVFSIKLINDENVIINAVDIFYGFSGLKRVIIVNNDV